jgi:hypothetical protein
LSRTFHLTLCLKFQPLNDRDFPVSCQM